METPKVYELAKELGTDSLSLIDKLKGIDILVKSHMSNLTHEQADKARVLLKEKKEPPKTKKTKKKVVRKKSATSAKKTVRKKASTSTPDSGEEEVKSERQARSSMIIRKRSGATALKAEAKVTTKEVPSHPSEDLDYSVDSPSEESTVSETAQSSQADAASSTNGASTESSSKVAEKVEKPKNFLTIVKTSPVPKKSKLPGKPSTPQKTEGKAAPANRIIKMNKETLDQLAEEEAAKKRAGAGRERTIRPEDVRFADYRKKEMIFLPKKKKIPIGKEVKKTQITVPSAHKRVVEINGSISVQDLALQMGIKAKEIVKKLFAMGQTATINQVIDLDTATLIANEYQHEVKNVEFKEEDLLESTEDQAEDLSPRPPVVTVMGHVDHGKTSLLDAIRESQVVAKEAGGITQHIGAYTITKDGKKITFIDTPGHEAFTTMRARGANVTDIVILVVAADDGVMPQTREAISHAQAANVPIIVAVNKMDKADANPEKIKQQLADLNILSEDWGGQTMFVPVSAVQKTNLDKLLEAINLNAEILELKSNETASPSGTILEARLEKGRGAVVSLLVNRGTVKIGDVLFAGKSVAKVKAILDSEGSRVKSVSPGMAAEIMGFQSVPDAGSPFSSTTSEADARKIIDNRIQKERESANVDRKKLTLENFLQNAGAQEVKELKVVLKTDVFGSLEAVKDSLTKASTDKVKVNVIHAATGGITDSDVLLASASRAIIIGFNVRPETGARKTAERENAEIKTYTIIYELIDDVKKAMAGLLDKKKVETFLGRAEVRQTFSVPKIGTIAGSAVIDGKMVRGSHVRLLRDSKVIYEGKMDSLRRFKDDAKEVATGYECGIGLENYNDIKPGDVIEAFKVDLVAQELVQ